MPIEALLTLVGATAAFILVAGLLLGIAAGAKYDRWKIWPAPPVGSLKSFAFWTLFRALNVVVLALAIDRILLMPAGQQTPWHVALAAISLIAGVAYLYALWALGRKATYCQASGLSTRGIYRFTRNPQYAAAILAFSALGLAADAWDATSLCFALAAVYALMARAEEPWLKVRYGRAYDEYRAQVPRFFSFRHALAEGSAHLRRITLFPASVRQRR